MTNSHITIIKNMISPIIIMCHFIYIQCVGITSASKTSELLLPTLMRYFLQWKITTQCQNWVESKWVKGKLKLPGVTEGTNRTTAAGNVIMIDMLMQWTRNPTPSLNEPWIADGQHVLFYISEKLLWILKTIWVLHKKTTTTPHICLLWFWTQLHSEFQLLKKVP